MSRKLSPEPVASDLPAVRVEPFESFYSHRLRGLAGLAYAVTGSSLAAEDLAQDALIAAYRDWDRIKELDDPDAWVRRVLINRAVSGYRRRIVEIKALARLADRPDAGNFIEVSEDADLIWAEVRKLPKRQIQVVALRYIEGLTMPEIAKILGCSKETVHTHLRRAQATLSQRLKQEDEE